jgi:hypothetical protein
MNLRALVRKAWRRLSGRSGSPDERKARRAAKRAGGRDIAKPKRKDRTGSRAE